jgi:formamidopyrimidine-DNA glycosylase
VPELPEIETVAKSLSFLARRQASAIFFYRDGLREAFPAHLTKSLPGQTLLKVGRRAKYLLLEFNGGTLIVHLGMSGSIKVTSTNEAPEKHDHMDLDLGDIRVRLRDPRRFGVVLWQGRGETNRALSELGPEPLEDSFNGEALRSSLKSKSSSIKTAIMDQGVVVGVGNIYASEALFAAKIDPRKKAGTLSFKRAEKLTKEIKRILLDSIGRGGSTLRDFHGVNGQIGTFATDSAMVYGRAGKSCKVCGGTIKNSIIGGRASAWCPACQKR